MDVDSNNYQSASTITGMPNKLIIKYAWISICFSTVVILAAILLQILVLLNIFPLVQFCLILLFAALLLYVCSAFTTLLIISKVQPERQHNHNSAETGVEYENIHFTQRMVEQRSPLSTSHLDNYQHSTLIPTPPPPYVESAVGGRTCRSKDKVAKRQRSRRKQGHRKLNNGHRRRYLHDQVQLLNRQVSAQSNSNSAGIETTAINSSQNTRENFRNSSKTGEMSEESVSSESEAKYKSKLHQISPRCRARKEGINAFAESERGQIILHQKSHRHLASKEVINASPLSGQKFVKTAYQNSHRHLSRKDDISASSKSEQRLPSVVSKPKQKGNKFANLTDEYGIAPTNLNTTPYKCQEIDSKKMGNIEEENLMPSPGGVKSSIFADSESFGVIDEVQPYPLAQRRTLKTDSAELHTSSNARKAHVDIKSPNRESMLLKSTSLSRSNTSRMFSNHQSSHTTSNRISSPSKLPHSLNSKSYNMSPNKQITSSGVSVPTKFPSVDNSKASMMSPNKKASCIASRKTALSQNTPMASVANKVKFSPNHEILNSIDIPEQRHASSCKQSVRQDVTMVCEQSGCTQTQINSKAKERRSLRSRSDISKKKEATKQVAKRRCSLQDPANLSHTARPDPAGRLDAFDFGVFTATNNALWNEAPRNKITYLL